VKISIPADHVSPPGNGVNRVVVLLSLIGGLGMLALALFLLAPLVSTTVDLAGIDKVLVVDRQILKPEPLERFLFIAGVLLLPFFLGASYLGVRRLPRVPKGRRIIEQLASPASWLMTPLVLVLLFSAGFADDRVGIRSLIPGGAISLAAAVVLALGVTAAAGGRFRQGTDRILRFLLPGLAGILFLGILSFSILGAEHIRNVPIFWASFNAFFFSVVQVFFGRQLLVDFTNQYGLYPHFIEPIFSLVGLSVYSFTALMGLLTCLAFGCMYRFLAKETGDELLAFLGLATILFFGYVSGRVVERDLYLQYHPLRILFPALSLVVVRAFARNPTPRLGALLLALGAAASLWNPDSGIIVLAAGFLLLVYDALLRRRPGEIPVRLLLGAAAAVAVIAFFSLYLRLRFGAFPDYTQLFLSPKAFYRYGAMMLPMPHFGLWVPVLTIYAAALLLSLAALVEGDDTPRARTFFSLSVLGLGLFTYYQGRSNLGTLTSAGYPAVLIGVLLAGDLRRRTLPRPPAADRILSLTLLALLCFSVPALATVAPAWVRGITEKVRVTMKNEEGEVLRDARFLRQHVRPGQEFVILSYNSGLHHLLTQTTSPLDVPGASELLYVADFDKMDDYVLKGRGMFAIDRHNVTADYFDAARRGNKLFYHNPYGSLTLFPAR
jgi:hypothetical protein